MIFLTLNDWIKVPCDQEGCVSSLQSNGKALEKMFNFHGGGLSPSTSFYGGQLFEKGGGDRIPSSERLDDERLEEDSLGLAMVEVGSVLRSFPRFNGGGGGLGGAMQERLLRGGNDADVEGNSPAVGPVRNVYVGRAGIGAWHDSR